MCALCSRCFGRDRGHGQQNLAPIQARQETMKKINEDTKVLSAMAKGEAPYDASKATAAHSSDGKTALTKGSQALFPDNSKTGEKTRASNPRSGKTEPTSTPSWRHSRRWRRETKAKATGSADSFKATFPGVIKAATIATKNTACAARHLINRARLKSETPAGCTRRVFLFYSLRPHCHDAGGLINYLVTCPRISPPGLAAVWMFT